MKSENLKIYEVISFMQNNLINLEVALRNKTMSPDIARKHIKEIIILSDKIEKQFNCEDLTNKIKSIAEDVFEKTTVKYNNNNKVEHNSAVKIEPVTDKWL